MIDRSTREPPSGATPGVSPNAILESIDSGDFLAGVMCADSATAVRPRSTALQQWCAIAVRDSSARQRYEGAVVCAPWGFAKGGCETSQG